LPTLAYAQLTSCTLPADAELSAEGDAARLRVTRGRVVVSITVPKSILEWFVDAADPHAGLAVSDWCDYTGYGESRAAVLEEQMAADTALFVERLLASELRVSAANTTASKVVMEWRINGAWAQAIPLSAAVT
jgi:hypothetical protein